MDNFEGSDHSETCVVTMLDVHCPVVRPTTILGSLSVALAIGGVLWTSSGQQHWGYPDNRAACFPGFTADESITIPTGLVVTSLRGGSEAQRNGIEVGDIIIAIDNAKVQSLSEAAVRLRQSGKVQTELRLLHKGTFRTVVLGRS